ncbi:hypothetical protein TRSC58_00853 [Trypanosoma rangeli SC58]|uniref:RING-type domain-containing protein n=1 Tax=Trypanosoma rangeli SC58 TaxID=429131 RepID=A0A061JDG3_TRYRA|nr:hypothetical protein TRSC58_00853 [Trypanosoma rangeli SC58]
MILLRGAGTPPPSSPSPSSVVEVENSDGALPVQGSAMLMLTQSPVLPCPGFVDGTQSRSSRSNNVASSIALSLRLENVVVMSGTLLAAVSSPLTQSSGRNANASNTSLLFDGGLNNGLPSERHLTSGSLSRMFTAPLSAMAVFPTRGAPVRGVSAKEVGCIMLRPGHTTDCVICLWSRDDANPAPPASQPVGAAATPNATAQVDATLESVKLSCGHDFHADCLQRWLLTSRVCPLCRQEVAPSSTEA